MPKSRNPVIEFDKLQMYFGEPYEIDVESAKGKITIYQPTVGEVIKIGEKKFYSSLNVFITNTTQYRLPLWEANIDWNEFSDFELFLMLYKSIDPVVTKLIFGELDFSKFEISGTQVEVPIESEKVKESTSEKSEESDSNAKASESDAPTPATTTILKVVPVLYDAENNIEINELVYQHIAQYLRNVFNTFPEEKLTSDAIMKKWFINKDKRTLEIESKKTEKQDTSIQSIISACLNHPGFKYNLKELKEVGICQFYDSVKRLQIYENSTACLRGVFAGFCDGSKLKSDDYNFMREI